MSRLGSRVKRSCAAALTKLHTRPQVTPLVHAERGHRGGGKRQVFGGGTHGRSQSGRPLRLPRR